MKEDENKKYRLLIAERVRRIMEIIDLDVPGFAEFLDKSSPHIYGISNGSRPLSEALAKEIGEFLEFDGMKIFNLNSPIPKDIRRVDKLIHFKKENKDNPEYFLSQKPARSVDTFILEVLIKTGFFDNGPKYLSETTKFCKEELNREFVDDELTKGLVYAVKKNILKSEKRSIKLKNGGLGVRQVDVYYR